jgi:predicted O-methyltransferase YrrM
MSESSTLATMEHYRYLAERTIQEDGFLRELKKAAQDAGLPPIWIAPEQGSFIQILLRLCGAREVVEVGTLAGYSAIWMARALPPGGLVRSIEISGKHAEFAEKWVAESDVPDRIRILRGAGKDILPKLKTDSADAAFLDADKANYSLYLNECLRIVRRGGLIMADNAFAFGGLFEEESRDDSVAAVRRFNDVMARQPALQSVIVPLGDGLWVAVKR